MERLLELTKKHKEIMEKQRVLIQVYNNASGFLWTLAMYDGGTDLGWSEFTGNCEWSGTFKTYEDAFENAISLVEKCSLERFRKETGNAHWGLYAQYIKGQLAN